jgi:hypothetical protein
MLKPDLFSVDFTSWKKHLDDKGFVVLENILSKDERERALTTFKNDMQTVSSHFDLEDPETFKIEKTPIMFSKGMAVFNGFGNSDFMWQVRLSPRILRIYELLFDTKELNVSLDGFSLFVSSDQKSKSWLHIDQNPSNSVYSIQGAYNFLPVGEKNAGFILIPESHKLYKPKVKGNADWIMFEKNKEGFEELEEKVVKLLIPENCFVLWNSRTIHANTGIVKDSRKKVYRFDRLTCYITFLPKNIITDIENLKKKRVEAYKNGETTSHWANKCEIKKYPYGFGKTYENRGFNKIKPKMVNNEIPKERLEYL